MPFKRGIEDGAEGTDDTEGQGLKKFHLEDGVEESEDTEGNKKHFRVEDGIESEDTEGNKKNFR